MIWKYEKWHNPILENSKPPNIYRNGYSFHQIPAFPMIPWLTDSMISCRIVVSHRLSEILYHQCTGYVMNRLSVGSLKRKRESPVLYGNSKSFFINHLVWQYYVWGTHFVLVGTENSYHDCAKWFGTRHTAMETCIIPIIKRNLN